MCILDNHLDGAVSKIFDLGPSFYFIKSRKINKKLPVFHHKIRTEKLKTFPPTECYERMFKMLSQYLKK